MDKIIWSVIFFEEGDILIGALIEIVDEGFLDEGAASVLGLWVDI
ncbi:hypothetical protein BN193_00125 [Lactococcus raffinolactis 4877]|nr:hypothetical protein BN193_00125 [Lactococcus raffinolactis 4877]